MIAFRIFLHIVSSANGLDSGRQSHRVEPLWQPISDKLEFRLVPASPERLQPLLLIGLFWCPTRWPRRPESRPLAEPSIDFKALTELNLYEAIKLSS